MVLRWFPPCPYKGHPAMASSTSTSPPAHLPPLATIEVPSAFSLRNSICSYGFYMTAPNRWVETPAIEGQHEKGAFIRPLLVPTAKGKSILLQAASSSGIGGVTQDQEVEDCRLLASLCCLPADGFQSITISIRQQWQRPVLDVAVVDVVEEGQDDDGVLEDEVAKRVVLAQARRMLRLNLREHRAREAFERLWCSHHCGGSKGGSNSNLEQEFEEEAMGEGEGEQQPHKKKVKVTCSTHANVEVGRLFRSPTFWEDCIKTITLCNSSWPRTLSMNVKLCEAFQGSFPLPCQFVQLSSTELQKLGGVGYRAERIIKLAESFLQQPSSSTVTAGALSTPSTIKAKGKKPSSSSSSSSSSSPSLSKTHVDIMWLESPDRTEEEVYCQVQSWHGFGPYAASTVCQLLGHYGRIPSDTETVRHLYEYHGVKTSSSSASGTGKRARGGNGSPDKSKLESALETLYGGYGDTRFLAYWCELWGAYEAKVGVSHMAELGHDLYKAFTANAMAKLTTTATSNKNKK